MARVRYIQNLDCILQICISQNYQLIRILSLAHSKNNVLIVKIALMDSSFKSGNFFI
jgi:hypothetical protein